MPIIFHNNRTIIIYSLIHRLTYSHSWGLPNECIWIRIRMHEKIFVKKRKQKKHIIVVPTGPHFLLIYTWTDWSGLCMMTSNKRHRISNRKRKPIAGRYTVLTEVMQETKPAWYGMIWSVSDLIGHVDEMRCHQSNFTVANLHYLCQHCASACSRMMFQWIVQLIIHVLKMHQFLCLPGSWWLVMSI